MSNRILFVDARSGPLKLAQLGLEDLLPACQQCQEIEERGERRG